ALVDDARVQIERRALLDLGPGVVDELLTSLRSAQSEVLMDEMARTLHQAAQRGLVDPGRLSDRLLPLLSSDNDALVSRAAATIGHLGQKAAIAGLQDLLKSPLRRAPYAAALEALARLGDDSSHDAAVQALESTDVPTRTAATRALGLFGRAADAQLIIDRVEDRADEVALAAIQALESMKGNTSAMRALHDVLGHSKPEYVRTAITVLERIANKGLSARHLRAVVSDEDRNYELRKQAAIALFQTFDDKDGLDVLMRPWKKYFAKDSKDAASYAQCAAFLMEFPDWQEAARLWERAIDLAARNPTWLNGYRIQLARCYSQTNKLSKAASQLEKSNYGEDWRALAEDPDFKALREHRKYRSRFGISDD
ncbi:MAG: HEAT repeat domain-containing protein, partial [Planctomycetes bacterium]|nr:HEAT repeat domain-containing protein [Planctomycetota bacterium]